MYGRIGIKSQSIAGDKERRPVMPLYELFCLAKPRIANADLASLMKQAGRIVLNSGGVLTDVKSFGSQKLAYVIKRPGERHAESKMWQITFASKPDCVKELEDTMRLDERVIRWAVLKRRKFDTLPTSYRVARAAEARSPTLFQQPPSGA